MSSLFVSAVDNFISRLLSVPYLTVVTKNILKQIQKRPRTHPLMANILRLLRGITFLNKIFYLNDIPSRGHVLRGNLMAKNFIDKLKPLQSEPKYVNPRHHPLDLLLQEILLPHPNLIAP